MKGRLVGPAGDSQIGAPAPGFFRVVARVIGKDVSIVFLVEEDRRSSLESRPRNPVGELTRCDDRVVVEQKPDVRRIETKT